MTQINPLTKTLALFFAGALAGCAAVDTKTVVLDSDTYLANNFTPAQLAPSVRTIVEKGEQLPKKFSRIEYRAVADLDEDGKVTQRTSVNTFINLGNGYIQNKAEYSNNGVPYRINLALTFAGIQRLKTQATFVNQSNAQHPIEIKEMSRFDRGLGTPQVGQIYATDVKTGSAPQLMNFIEEKDACTAGPSVPATSVHTSLSGTAVPLDCTTASANGVIVNRSKFMWIADLGVAFQTVSSTARSSTLIKIESVSIQR